MTPTREQLEAARAYLARMAQASAFSRETADAIEVVLAATAPPTDGKLAEEAACHAMGWVAESDARLRDIVLDCMRGKDPPPASFGWIGKALAYIAGARREGWQKG